MSFIGLSVTVTHGGCHQAVKVHDGDGLTYCSHLLTSFPSQRQGRVPRPRGRDLGPPVTLREGISPSWTQLFLRVHCPVLHWWLPKCPHPPAPPTEGSLSFLLPLSMVSPGIWGVPYMQGTSTVISEAKK